MTEGLIRFPNIFYSPDAGGGAAGDGGKTAGEHGTSEHWTSQHAYFQDNPDAVKAFKDFKTADDAFKAHVELRKQQSQPFRLPKDGTKLTDAQRAELRAGYAKINGVPDSPEGYEITIPDGAAVDEQGINDWKAFAHEHGLPPDVAQQAVDFQLAFVDRLNKARIKVIEGLTNANYKTFLNDDCGGDKEVAGARLEMVKKYLQTFCTKDGKPDPKTWESFAARILHNDRLIELPLLRALMDAAQRKVGTGGSPGGSGNYEHMGAGGKRPYAEMHGK